MLEMEGLYFESETHEWFKDQLCTKYAQKGDNDGITLPKVSCFILRNKDTGLYTRAMMDTVNNAMIFDCETVKEMALQIDGLKTYKKQMLCS